MLQVGGGGHADQSSVRSPGMDDELTFPRYTCPSCGEHTVVPVVFGMPAPILGDAADRGEVILGGCDIPYEFTGREVECTACGWLGQTKKRGPGIMKRRIPPIY